jgi:hypothetical protein
MPGTRSRTSRTGVDGEAAVHGAVALPEDHLRVLQLLHRQAAARLVRVVDDAVLEGQAQLADGGVAAEVLVGHEQHLAASRVRPLERALGVAGGADRPAVPPVNALMAALLFMYVTGTVTSATPASRRTSQHSSTWSKVAMSAIEQPAARSGSSTPGPAGEDVGRLGHEVHAAEDDELRLRAGRRLLRELEAVARDVGELDDLVALVVVAEHEHPVAERLLGARGAVDQRRVGGRRQLTGQSTPRSEARSAWRRGA